MPGTVRTLPHPAPAGRFRDRPRVAIREPWRSHLAQGDQWVTVLALRWSRAWHRDGALASRLALVESPPTAEFAGPR
jgi:hypothetical protein